MAALVGIENILPLGNVQLYCVPVPLTPDPAFFENGKTESLFMELIKEAATKDRSFFEQSLSKNFVSPCLKRLLSTSLLGSL
jgi:hypothetical protein